MNTSNQKLTKLDYEYLTGNWQPPYGAAYNCVAEDCHDFGWADAHGIPTILGTELIKEYEKTLDIE